MRIVNLSGYAGEIAGESKQYFLILNFVDFLKYI